MRRGGRQTDPRATATVPGKARPGPEGHWHGQRTSVTGLSAAPTTSEPGFAGGSSGPVAFADSYIIHSSPAESSRIQRPFLSWKVRALIGGRCWLQYQPFYPSQRHKLEGKSNASTDTSTRAGGIETRKSGMEAIVSLLLLPLTGDSHRSAVWRATPSAADRRLSVILSVPGSRPRSAPAPVTRICRFQQSL